MGVRPHELLSARIQPKSVILLTFLSLHFVISVIVVISVVIPSYANGTTSDVFATDSTVYVYFADSLRRGEGNPWVIGSMLEFPNTLWTPVITSLILHSALLVMLFNYSLFVISAILLKKSFPISSGVFIFLLLLNPTTTTSILCVSKEIFDLLAISLFMYGRTRRNKTMLILALVVSLLNRWEVCLVVLTFICISSRINPLRNRRIPTLLVLILALNFVMPLLGSEILVRRFQEAESMKFIATLDSMQMNYMYVLAVIPKIAINLFGYLFNVAAWRDLSSWLDIMIGNNISYVIVLFVLAVKRSLRVQHDIIYLCITGALIIAQSLVPQPRYFYFLYILLCLQAAHAHGGIRFGGGVLRCPILPRVIAPSAEGSLG